MVPSVEDVLARYSAEWLAVPGVVGTGIGAHGEGRCIVIFVVEPSAEIERRMPKAVEGFPVRIEVGGRVYPRG